jgi:hypothetical protein
MTEKLLEVPRLIDRKLWTEAQLGGVAFLTPKNAPPGLGLIFTGAAAGLAIFDGWRADLGERDDGELLRVAIIEGEVAGKPPGYTLTIGLDLEALAARLRDRSLDGLSYDVSAPGAIRRRMNTPPGGSPHLAAWRPLFAAAGEYALVPVVNGAEGWEPHYEKGLGKKKLLFRRAQDIQPGDPDFFALE